MTKIFFIQSNSEAYVFGIGTYLKNLIKGLLLQPNLMIYLINIKKTNRPPKYEKYVNNNYIEITLDIQDLIEDKKGLFEENHARALFGLLNDELKSEGKIIFHLNTILDYWILKVAKEYGFSTVYTQHVNLWQIFYRRNFNKFLKDWNDRNNTTLQESVQTNLRSIEYDKKILTEADQLILLNSETIEFTKKFYQIDESKISFIENGLFEFPKLNKKKIRSELGFAETDFIVTYVGRLIEQKGLDILIKAFHTFSKNNKSAKLLIVGRGDFEKYLKLSSKSMGKIIYTGFLNEKYLNQIYSISDLCINPSLSEQNSYVVLEIMSKGLPIIISDISAYNENRFIHMENVLKIPVNNQIINQKDLINILQYGYNNFDKMKSIGKNAAQTYKKFFTQDHMIKKTLDTYKQA